MLYDASYQHWEGRHEGVWRRRAAIAGAGLAACLRSRWIRFVVSSCWLLCLVQIAILFLIGQLLIVDSLVVLWLGNLNPQLQALARSLMTWLVEHPEISVHTTENFLFHFFATRLLPLSMVAVALALPFVITRDLASRAIVIYSSKAVSRFDYFLGKFGVLFGLLCLTWLGPLCVAWAVGNFLATDWNFFWHSRRALGNTLVFVLGGMTVLSMLGMGVSALSGKERTTVFIWIFWWLIGGALVKMSVRGASWLKYSSVHFNLKQFALGVFELGDDLSAAQENLPMLGPLLRGVSARTLANFQNPEWGTSVAVLAVLLGVTAVVLAWRVRPE